MKKLLLLFLIFFSINPQLKAQNRLGIAGGINLATFNLEEGQTDLDNRSGITVGGIFDFVISKTVTVRLAPLYVQKGAKQKTTNHSLFGNSEITYKTTYFEVPVFLKVGFGAGAVRPYGLFGPTFGFNMSSEREVRGADSKNVTDIETAIQLFDIGIGVGGGISIPINRYLVFIEARYVVSITNVHSGRALNFTGETLGLGDEIKNRGIQVMLGGSL